MLDIKFIREHKDAVDQNNASRNVQIDLAELLTLDDERIALQQKVDTLRAERNKRSKSKPSEEEIKLMRKLGEEVAGLEELTGTKEQELVKRLARIPNMNHPTTPVGSDENSNVVVNTIGVQPEFTFDPKEHFAVEHVKDLIDLERGAKVGGSRFYFLKGKLAILERALMQFAIDTLVAKGFELVLPPLLVEEGAMYGTGFFPADKNEVYSVNPDDDDLYLVGTSEVPLIYMHSGEVFESEQLPKKYLGITPCFRREAGSYGKDTKGIFRVHQFYKVEMVIFAKPEDSWTIHEEILANEETILKALGLPYQVVNICSGDLGFPAAKKYDCEGWFPGQQRYRELTSTSNTTDYQARRSNVKYKTATGSREFLHTLNGTAVTTPTVPYTFS
jgi:seryl-tRNA synthetase